jgi:hypothetical protein
LRGMNRWWARWRIPSICSTASAARASPHTFGLEGVEHKIHAAVAKRKVKKWRRFWNSLDLSSWDYHLQDVLQCILIRVEQTRAFNMVFFIQHHFYKESRIRSIRHEEHTNFDARSTDFWDLWASK